jgi:hypothetical protein
MAQIPHRSQFARLGGGGPFGGGFNIVTGLPRL